MVRHMRRGPQPPWRMTWRSTLETTHQMTFLFVAWDTVIYQQYVDTFFGCSHVVISELLLDAVCNFNAFGCRAIEKNGFRMFTYLDGKNPKSVTIILIQTKSITRKTCYYMSTNHDMTPTWTLINSDSYLEFTIFARQQPVKSSSPSSPSRRRLALVWTLCEASWYSSHLPKHIHSHCEFL